MKKKEESDKIYSRIKGAVLLFLVVASIFALSSNVSAAGSKGFELNSLILKVSMKSGDSVSRVLTIAQGSGEQVSMQIINVPGMKLSEDNFILNIGESKNIAVTFNSFGLKDGVYVGSIKISDSKKSVFLPVIFEVESVDVFYDINLDIPPQYSTINPGEKIVAQLKVFDLTWGGITQGLGANTVNVDYFVYNIEGNVISSESESSVIDRQTAITKTVSFPKNVKEGDYVFVVVAKYKSSVGVASYLFSIKSQSSISNGLSGDIDWKFISIIAVVLIVFFGLIFSFVYIIRDRDSLILKMKKYNEENFRRQRSFILQQERVLREKKGKNPKKLKAEVKQKIKALRSKHKTRIATLETLKKKGYIETMKKKLNE